VRDVVPLILEGKYVRLEPLSLAHAPGLFAIGQAKEIWEYTPTAPFVTLADAVAWIENALENAKDKTEMPFAIIDRKREMIAGATRYAFIRFTDRSLELSKTWLGTAWWRTATNTETRYLMLRHAFETWGIVRVQLRVITENFRSRRAVERLGAVREGLLRKSRIYHGSDVHDAICYSIVDDEWPTVKLRLQRFLARKPIESIRGSIEPLGSIDEDGLAQRKNIEL
jgi:N-acetyltransferase